MNHRQNPCAIQRDLYMFYGSRREICSTYKFSFANIDGTLEQQYFVSSRFSTHYRHDTANLISSPSSRMQIYALIQRLLELTKFITDAEVERPTPSNELFLSTLLALLEWERIGRLGEPRMPFAIPRLFITRFLSSKNSLQCAHRQSPSR